MSREKGTIAEEIACTHLRAQGFEIIDRNVYSRFGEIDIIALKDEVLHFVEVKSAVTYEAALQNITPTKLERVLKTAEGYMQRHQLSLDFEIDAVAVVGGTPCFIGNITL